ncbi:hypothetical protein KTO58_19805 [Chitinophaga pendula]|uniref:hypothetical protein n=1 Tax=Chitinophaga TaxID=79328 RepID=UPI000BAF5818|nr:MULTISPECIES: hypothetical protein [Chitinophaga]ASZ11087.1 hypothetical protein CK934_08995 [Chitinophaga sp. MD30]UCJ05916.1 hypothetical protein KTO58_19805 [Chitinophaga pendula]
METLDINVKLIKHLKNYEEHCIRIEKSAAIDIDETPEQKQARIEDLESDYIKWFEYYLKVYAKNKCAWFHKEFANAIIDNTEIFQMLEIYRSGAKSVHAVVGVPLFLHLTGRLKMMLLIGETQSKANRLLSGLQAQLARNPRIINDYGHQIKSGDWAEGDFMTAFGGRFIAVGYGQNVRGLSEGADRPDYIAIDDIDNKRHVNNNELMKAGVEWIMEDVWGCFDEAENSVKRFVYCNNNFHKNSITNRLEQQFKTLIQRSADDGVEPVHKILKVKAVKDLITFEPEWPEKTSSQYWRNKYRNTPSRSFQREYMHIHIQDGTVFAMEDMQWKPILRYNEYDAIEFYGDLSYKKAACFKSIVALGLTGKEIHVLHVFLRQSKRTVIAEWLYDLYERYELHRFPFIRYRLEGFFSMDDFIEDFDNVGKQRKYIIPITADKSPKGDKYERIEADQPYFERRDVWLNEAERYNPDQIELVEQFLSFEKGNEAPIDGPDAFNGALSKLHKRGRNKKGQYRVGRINSRKY